MVRCMQTIRAEPLVPGSQPVNQSLESSILQEPEVEIVGIVKTGMRTTNRNLTETRRMVFESFRQINEDNPEVYGVPGSTRWMSGLLNHFNEPNVVSLENLKIWLEKNPHIRRTFSALIPFGEFGIGVFANERGTRPKRRRGCKRSPVFLSESSTVPNSWEPLSNATVGKRIKVEKTLELDPSDAEMDDGEPGRFQGRDEKVEQSASSETESAVETEVETEEEIDVETEDGSDSVGRTSNLNFHSAAEVQAKWENALRDEVSSISVALPSATINDERMIERSQAVWIQGDVEDQYLAINGEANYRPTTPGHFLDKEYPRLDELCSDPDLVAFAETTVASARDIADQRIMEFGTSNIEFGMGDPVTSSTGKAEGAVIGNEAVDFEMKDSDEAYTSVSSSEIIALPGTSTADSDKDNQHQPGSSKSSYLVPNNGQMYWGGAEVKDGQLIVEATLVDPFTYGCDLMAEFRRHCQNHQEFQHCLPLVDTVEFIYRSNEYRDFIYRSQSSM